MAELAVILGSGFSKNAKLPLATEISKYFERDNKERILQFSSGEFKWVDFASKTDIHNGRNNYDHLAYGILLNELVKVYKNKMNGFLNYEDFYQYVVDNIGSSTFVSVLKATSLASFNKEHYDLLKDKYWHEQYTRKIRNPNVREIKSLINHLIDDLLYVREPKERLLEEYFEFIEFIKHFSTIDFVTLNHDTLLEFILSEFVKTPFTDGFSKDNSELQTLEGEKIKTFTGVFNNNINVIKLHGSVDTYNYEIVIENGTVVTRTGEYIYYKTNDYYTKHGPFRHNKETGERIQSFHLNIDPNFIVGTRKEDLIKELDMYKKMYSVSENLLMRCKTLLIIGYSFSDQHVNTIIEKSIDTSKTLELIIHINPSIEFPIRNDRIKDLNGGKYKDLLDTLNCVQESEK